MRSSRVGRAIDSVLEDCAGSEMDVASHVSALTLDIVGVVLFSHEFHDLKAVEEWATQQPKDTTADAKNELEAFQFNL
jgi:hypothetical protein